MSRYPKQSEIDMPKFNKRRGGRRRTPADFDEWNTKFRAYLQECWDEQTEPRLLTFCMANDITPQNFHHLIKQHIGLQENMQLFKEMREDIVKHNSLYFKVHATTAIKILETEFAYYVKPDAIQQMAISAVDEFLNRAKS